MIGQRSWFNVVGVSAWKVTKNHTWDAVLNNTFNPLLCTVEDVAGDTVTLSSHAIDGTFECDVSQIYPNRDACVRACPPAYADD